MEKGNQIEIETYYSKTHSNQLAISPTFLKGTIIEVFKDYFEMVLVNGEKYLCPVTPPINQRYKIFPPLSKMKRPNEYSKPLGGTRPESYHPADLNGQYVKDLNKYIDYLESKIKNALNDSVCPSCKSDFVVRYGAYTSECQNCGKLIENKNEETV